MRESLAAVVAALPPKKPKGKKRHKIYLSPDAATAPVPSDVERRLAALETELGFTRPEEELQVCDDYGSQRLAVRVVASGRNAGV